MQTVIGNDVKPEFVCVVHRGSGGEKDVSQADILPLYIVCKLIHHDFTVAMLFISCHFPMQYYLSYYHIIPPLVLILAHLYTCQLFVCLPIVVY